jgi:chemotaxis protein methyltransferase CheR
VTVATDIRLDDRDFRRVSELVYRHCGINLHEGKQDLVQARLAKVMRDGRFASTTDYIDHVLADESGVELTALVDVISTNLTSFFRERSHFDHLTKNVLPGRAASRPSDRRIRAWSAGCSTGEEPYSLAITLLQALPEWDVKVLATDISTRVVRRATEGVYPADRLATVDAGVRDTYFRRCPASRDQFQVADSLRDVVRFRHLNLMQPWPFTGPFDFIFCRNVMIYFDKPTQERLVRRFCSCLAPGGLLFTGHSESLTGIAHPFRYVEPSIYEKP